MEKLSFTATRPIWNCKFRLRCSVTPTKKNSLFLLPASSNYNLNEFYYFLWLLGLPAAHKDLNCPKISQYTEAPHLVPVACRICSLEILPGFGCSCIFLFSSLAHPDNVILNSSACVVWILLDICLQTWETNIRQIKWFIRDFFLSSRLRQIFNYQHSFSLKWFGLFSYDFLLTPGTVNPCSCKAQLFLLRKVDHYSKNREYSGFFQQISLEEKN